MPQILNKNTLKYLAIIMMIIDHVTLFFINPQTDSILYSIFRLLGRLTIPIMCYFIAEGFIYTKSKFKYGLRLAVFAIISQFAFTFALNGTILTWKLFTDWNVIVTLLIGYLIIVCYEYFDNKYIKTLLCAFLIVISYFGDWGLFAPVWILTFHVFRDQTKLKYLLFILVALMRTTLIYLSGFYNQTQWYLFIWQIGVIFTIPLLLMYNHEPGKKSLFHQYFFYIFYPGHLVLIRVIVMIILHYR